MLLEAPPQHYRVGFHNLNETQEKTGNLFKIHLQAKFCLILQQDEVTAESPSWSPFWSALTAMDWQISTCFLVSTLSRISSNQSWSRPCLLLHPAQITLTGIHLPMCLWDTNALVLLYCTSACIPISLDNYYMGYLDESNVLVISNTNRYSTWYL